MGRYRPPAKKSSPYITPAGQRAGDAEYIYRKKQLRELDRRIRYLQKRLPELKVVGTLPADRGRIFFGAQVTLEDETGKEIRYRIVGADEFDPARGWISVDAPLARALLNKAPGDEVRVDTPGGRTTYLVLAIDYPG